MYEPYMIIMKRYEEKLREFMTEEEFVEFSKQVAKESFFNELSLLPDSDFKDFAIDHFQQITADGDDFIDWMNSLKEAEEDDKRDCENCKNYVVEYIDVYGKAHKGCLKWDCEFEQAESEGEDE